MTIADIISHLLTQRGITDKEQFLHPDFPSSLSLESIGFSKEKKILLTTLEQIKKDKKTIVVYTDYDTDGITGGAILWETLHHLGFKVFPYVPHRQSEGYGFSKKGIDNAIQKYHPSLFISVDHGISARKEIDYISEKGIPVIVTDHHTKPEDPPTSALALFHFPAVSGAGVAYLVSQDIARHFKMEKELFTKLFSIDLLALASLGMVADLVPLVGYARMITYHGLKAFSKSSQPGIRALLKVAGLDETVVLSPYHLGFALAPRINAVGRLSHAIDALRMLCTTNSIRAEELALSANHHNGIRQRMVESSVKDALLLFEKNNLPRILVAVNPQWNEGIIGLISSKLTEAFYLPSVVLTKAENGWKASARSISGFDIIAFLRSLDMLEHVGGHPQAAGFSVSDEQKDILIAKIQALSRELPPFPKKEQRVDLILPLALATEQLATELEKLEPFGIGNPKPIFQSEGIIGGFQTMGKTKEHIRFTFLDIESQTKKLECVYFSPSEEQKKLISQQKKVTLNFTLEKQTWRGATSVKGFIKSIVT